jgi:hypothetical protein
VSNEVRIMMNARQTISFTLPSLWAYLGWQPQSEQKTTYERELDRLLTACEDEAPGVRRYIGLLKRRAWWV